MKVVHVQDLPLYEADPPVTRLNKIIVDNVLGAEKISVGLGIYRKGENAEWHAHPESEEVMYFTKGRGVILLENGEKAEIVPDTVTYVPIGERHKIENTGEDSLEFIFMYSPPGPESGIKKWKVVN